MNAPRSRCWLICNRSGSFGCLWWGVGKCGQEGRGLQSTVSSSHRSHLRGTVAEFMHVNSVFFEAFIIFSHYLRLLDNNVHTFYILRFPRGSVPNPGAAVVGESSTGCVILGIDNGVTVRREPLPTPQHLGHGIPSLSG